MRIPEPLTLWYGGLAPRERRLVTTGGVLAALLVLYLAVVSPLQSAYSRTARQVSSERSTLVWLNNAAGKLQNAGPAGAARGHLAPGQSVLAAVSSAARGASVSGAIQRIEQAGDGGARITVSSASFDELVRWLGTLMSDDGVVVVDANLQQDDDTGTVKGSLTLNTGT